MSNEHFEILKVFISTKVKEYTKATFEREIKNDLHFAFRAAEEYAKETTPVKRNLIRGLISGAKTCLFGDGASNENEGKEVVREAKYREI